VNTDAVFHALSHPTRRAVVAQLGRGAASVGELAVPFEVSLPTFCSHLRVLEGAGLVRSAKSGRVRTYTLVPDGLRAAEGWLAEQRTHWTARLDQLDEFLSQPEPESP
jgi:DNA-binding transcriptional ArsR family regulator